MHLTYSSGPWATYTLRMSPEDLNIIQWALGEVLLREKQSLAYLRSLKASETKSVQAARNQEIKSKCLDVSKLERRSRELQKLISKL